MAAANSNYELLLAKLDKFIRKYYLNKFIRGTLYCIGIVLALFIVFNSLEYYYYFGKSVRKAFFFSFIAISGISVIWLMFIPLLKYFRLGKIISKQQAATIIGEHFKDVKDKLLNILQLNEQSKADGANTDLILAGISQKSEDIKLVPFKKAIDLTKNKKYLPYALPPLLALLFILVAAPSIIKDGATRIINNDTEFEREAPFTFQVENEILEVIQYEDYLLKVKTEGLVLPNEAFVDLDGYQYKMTQAAKGEFTYKFNKVQKDINFKVFSGGFFSKEYQLVVLKKPDILGFDVTLDYPAYTGRKDEQLQDIGDMVVPKGTNLKWLFKTRHTDNIRLKFSSEKNAIEAKRSGAGDFSHKRRAMSDAAYKMYVSNEFLKDADSVAYSITVVPDLNPNISVEKFQDSTDSKLLFFVGDASDDYGLKKLTFNYQIKHVNGSSEPMNSIPVKSVDGKTINYDYTWDLAEFNLKPGDDITYYFEVFDNDGVNGSKSARTQLMTFKVPTIEEFEKMEDENNEEIKEDLEEAIKETKEIQEKMKEMREKLLQEEEMDWQDKKELERLMEQKKELENKIEEAKENFEENLKNQEEFDQVDEEMLEKQEQIQELFEELMSDEMKELMQKMEELMEKLNKEETMENLEEMEMNDEEMEMELDRMLELFKQLEMESEIQDQIENLEELAKETEQLSEDTKEDRQSQEQLEQKQEEIQEKFDEIQEKMEELNDKNQELENPKNLDGMDEAMEEIQEQLDQGQEQLEQKQNDGASDSQKKAAEKMEQAAQQMQQQMQAGEMEQMEEDIDALRQLLENLITLSFEQEEVMDEIAKTAINTPRYIDLVQGQYKIKDDFKIVEDSLHALSKRVYQIESFITEKVADVKNNIKEGLDNLEERQKQPGALNQHASMKGMNDLALMLSEVMNQMQQQMANSMAGQQMCQKPGGKQGKGKDGKGPKDLKGMQEGLNKQMEQMQKAMQKGDKGMSKRFAEMARKQAAIRQALEEMQRKKQQSGQGGDKEIQDLINQMNKTETELVNKKLGAETMKRQKDIMTRLLKSEKAEREREYDQQRKAERTVQKERKMPPSLEEYIKKREAEVEMYRTVSPALKPYYKFLVEEYYKSLKKTGASSK